jgi:hypothetical protein
MLISSNLPRAVPMQPLPDAMLPLLASFTPVFSTRGGQQVQGLLAGAIGAPAPRTVTAARRVMGVGHVPPFPRAQRGRKRAVWSSRTASRLLLPLLVAVFVPAGPLVVGVEETRARRRGGGAKMAANGLSRAAVRSRHPAMVKASYGQGPGAARGLPDAPGPDPLGGAGVGAPVLHGACAG